MGKKTLWPGWETVRQIKSGNYGTVYEIERKLPSGNKEKAAVKVISIPKEKTELDELRSQHYTKKAITRYFEDRKKRVSDEYEHMLALKGNTNIVTVDDFDCVQKDDGFGWDIYLKMELLTPLLDSFEDKITEVDVVNIGKDICTALTLCDNRGIIHRDIKPSNILVSKDGDYKLGDFGIARVMEIKSSSLTKGIGTYDYMAPEVRRGEKYDKRADIYSLGLVLYWLLNEKKLPFHPALPTGTQKENALERRFNGESIPAPAHGSNQLKQIVLKACAFDPKDRYQSAEEMIRDLAAHNPSSESFELPKKLSEYAVDDDIGQDDIISDSTEDGSKTPDIFDFSQIVDSAAHGDDCGQADFHDDLTIDINPSLPKDEPVDKKAPSLRQSIADILADYSGLIKVIIGAVLVLALVVGVIHYIKQQQQQREKDSVVIENTNQTDEIVADETTSIDEPVFIESDCGVAIAKTIVVEDAGVTITADRFSVDEAKNTEAIVLRIENNGPAAFFLSHLSLQINGYFVEGYLYDVDTIKPNTVVEGEVRFDPEYISLLGANKINEFALSFKATDAESFNTLWESDLVTIPVQDNRERVFSAIPVNLGVFNEEGIKLDLVGYKVGTNEASLYFYLNNGTNPDIRLAFAEGQLNAKDASIFNGYIFSKGASSLGFCESIYRRPLLDEDPIQPQSIKCVLQTTASMITVVPNKELSARFDSSGHITAFDIQNQEEVKESEVSVEQSSSWPSREDLLAIIESGNISTVSTTGAQLTLPTDSQWLTNPFRAKVKSPRVGSSILIMPMPKSENGNLGAIDDGTEVWILGMRSPYYYFFVSIEDGRMGWNGTEYFTT